MIIIVSTDGYCDIIVRLCNRVLNLYKEDMKQVLLSSLENADQFLDAATPVYAAMLHIAAKENNLRAYCIARLMLSTLTQAKHMLVTERKTAESPNKYLPYGYIHSPRFFYVEETDTVKDIVEFGDRFVYHPVMAG